MASYDLGSAYGKVIIDTANVNRAATAFGSFSTAMLGIGVAAGAGFGAAVNAAADFERSLDTFGAISGATAEQMDRVREKVLQLGQDSIFSANQVAHAVAELSKAGVDTEDIMNGAADAAVNLAAATDTDLTVAAEVAAGAMNTFNLSGKDLIGVADSIAKAVNASSINTQDLAYSLKYAGAPAAQLGLSIQETTAAIGLLGKAGITGSTAGTSLRRILLNLSPASKEAAATMKELGIITADGTNQFYNAAGGAKSMEEIMGILNTATKDLSASQKVQALNTIFGNRAVGSAVLLANQGAEGFRAYTDELNKLPSSADIASGRLDNLSGDFEILKGNIDTMLVDAGSPFQQMLREWVQDLTKLVQAFNDLDPATQKMIFQFLGMTAALATGAALFTGVISATFRFISAIKQVAAAFTFIARVTGIATLFSKVWYELSFLFLRLTTAVGGWSGALRVLMSVMGPVITAVSWLARGIALVASAIAGSTIALVVIAVVALGAAFYAAYKYIKPFHEAVDATWQALQRAWDAVLGFARDLPGNFSKAFASARESVTTFIQDTIQFFRDLPGNVVTFIQELPGRIAAGFSTVVETVSQTLSQLPNTIATWLGAGLGRIIAWGGQLAAQAGIALINFINSASTTLAELPGKIAYWLGFALGRIVRWVIDTGIQAYEMGTKFVDTVVTFISTLPDRIAEWLTNAWNKAVLWTAQMILEAELAIRGFIMKAEMFIQQLPGMIEKWLTDTWNKAVDWVAKMILQAELAARGFIMKAENFIKDLPEMIKKWLNDAYHNAIQWGIDMIEKAKSVATDFVNGFKDGIKTLPDKLDEVINGLLDAIKNAKDRLYEGIKDVGKNLVGGFLDGLDKHSPSAIERAMFEVVDGVGRSMDDLQGHVEAVHGLTNSLSGFGGDYSATLTAAGAGGGSSGDLNITMEFNGVSADDIPAIRSAMSSTAVLTKLTQAARAGRRG